MYKITRFLDQDHRISQSFGERPEYYQQFGFLGHEGVDYATPVGTELFAPFDGIILKDQIDKAYGNYLVIFDPIQKCAMWFCHLNDTPVNAGDRVTRGQLVAHTGNTGNSTGPHLHVNLCETDSQGNRLNLTNGYKGFLDLLKMVEYIEMSDPKEQIIIDVYKALTGKYPSDDVKKWRLQQGKNTVELIEDICGGDGDFRLRWVLPYCPKPIETIPTTTETPQVPQTPPSDPTNTPTHDSNWLSILIGYIKKALGRP